MHNRQSRIQDFVMKLIKRQQHCFMTWYCDLGPWSNVSQWERIKNWLFSYNTSHAVSAEFFLTVVKNQPYGSQLQLFKISTHRGENYEAAFQDEK